MSEADRAVSPVAAARAYLAVQALAGAAWWLAIVVSQDVRRWTLGNWDPAVLAVPDLVLFVGASAVAAVRASRTAATIAGVWTTLVTGALGVHGLVDQMAGPGVVLMVVATIGTVSAAATLWTGELPRRWFFVGPFAFRVAEDAPVGQHLRRSLAQLVVFWTVFFGVVPVLLAAVERRLGLRLPALSTEALTGAGAALFVAASAVGLWSCFTMARVGHGTPLPAEAARELVVEGPYRWVRNPMAVAGALQTVGVGLMFGSWTVIVVALAGAVVWNVLIRPEEEADLLDRFGPSYERYRSQVRCWLPRARRASSELGNSPSV